MAAFYLLPTRGWEFIAGGLVFFAGRDVKALKKYSKALLWSGFSLLLLAFILIDSSYTWPSAWALLPVLATALIMLAQRSQSILTAHPIAQWLGDRSYSLYLWHWPIVVGLYFASLHTDWLWITAGLALSLLLGDLSYRLIETPTRVYFSKASSGKEIFVLGAVVMLVGVSAVSARLFVFERRLASEVELAANESKNFYANQNECISISDSTNKPIDCYSNDLELGAISIGDSHASATFTALAVAAEQSNSNAMHWAKSACPTLKGAEFQNRATGCYAFNELAFSRLNSEFKKSPVVLVNRLTRALIGGNEDAISAQGVPHIYFEEKTDDGFSQTYQDQFKASLIKTSCILSQDHPVYLVRPIPEMIVNVPNTIARNIIFGRGNDDIKITLEEYHERHAFVWQAQDLAAEQCGVKILNPLPYLCDDQYCYGSKNGRPLYYDDDHLSEYGNKFLVPMFEQVFTDQQLTPSQ